MVYGITQQNYRQSANDPQVHIAESTASMLSSNQDITPFLPLQNADLTKSLATFIIVYDDKGQATISTAKLDGITPDLPRGVLDYAQSHGQNKVTWEPQKGVRVAAVITRYDKGYVLAGRSLREVEIRIVKLQQEVGIAWIVTIIAAFLGTWFLLPNLKNKTH